MQVVIKSIVFVFITVSIFSCKSEKEDFVLDYGYEYYPAIQGEYWNYQVDSIIYRNLGAIRDSSTSFIREEIAETFVDNIQDTVHRIERFYNPTYTEDWEVTDEWYSQSDNLRVLRTEENLKYIKMVFPLTEGERWNGNAFLDESAEIGVGGETIVFFIDWEYKVLSINESETIGGITYDNVVTIQNADNFDPNGLPENQDKLHRRLVIEKYAKDVGLVYKRHMILDSQCTTEDCETIPWEEKAQKGYIMEMTLVEHGS